MPKAALMPDSADRPTEYATEYRLMPFMPLRKPATKFVPAEYAETDSMPLLAV